jgi:hypothetical protein
MPFVIPQDDKRTTLVGKTGSGKTQAGIWQLSERSIDLMPWYILDFKRDKLINQIPYLQESTLENPIASQPGVYIVHPLPDDTEAVEAFLWKLWAHENVGLFIDEGYMLGNSPAFRALLTQGRSKNIPLIVLSQRPVWISRFAFSEADYFQVFWLNDARDRKTIQSFIPFDLEKRLPAYYSVWYDIGADETLILKPVPSRREILNRFSQRLAPVVETAQKNTKPRIRAI